MASGVQLETASGELALPALPVRSAPDRRIVATRTRWWVEALVVVWLCWVYDAIANFAPLRLHAALAHGYGVLHLEQALHLDPELALNQWLAAHRTLGLLLSDYYDNAHFIVTLGLLGWLWYRRADIYRPLRNALVAINVLGFVVFLLYPTAPPRLLGSSGFSDVVAATGALGGWHTGALASAANQLAAMPSLHMAWAVWCSLALWSLSTRPWVRVAAVLYPCMTCLAVIATGNHYLLDVLAGVATAALAVALVRALEAWRRPRGAGDYALDAGSRYGVYVLARLHGFLIAPLLWWAREIEQDDPLEHSAWQRGKADAINAAKDGRVFGLVATVATCAAPAIVGFATVALPTLWQVVLVAAAAAFGYLLVPTAWAICASIVAPRRQRDEARALVAQLLGDREGGGADEPSAEDARLVVTMRKLSEDIRDFLTQEEGLNIPAYNGRALGAFTERYQRSGLRTRVYWLEKEMQSRGLENPPDERFKWTALSPRGLERKRELILSVAGLIGGPTP